MDPLTNETLHFAAWVALAVYAAALVYAAVSDLVKFEIPNWTSAAALVAFFPVEWAAGLSASEIGAHLSTGAIILVIGFLMYLKGMSGAGDVKLLAVAAVWVGWRPLLEFLVVIALAGGVLALLILAYRRVPAAARIERVAWLARLYKRDAGIPYGIAICAASLYLLPYLPLVQALKAH